MEIHRSPNRDSTNGLRLALSDYSNLFPFPILHHTFDILPNASMDDYAHQLLINQIRTVNNLVLDASLDKVSRYDEVYQCRSRLQPPTYPAHQGREPRTACSILKFIRDRI
jgi:hypothetical protein